MANAPPASLKDEIDAVRRNLPKIQLPTTTHHFLTAIYEKTPTRRIKATLTFPENTGYPAQALIVDVAAERGIPPGLKRKLDKELTLLAKEKVGTYQQVETVLQRLQDFIDTNRFVPCWKELKQSVETVQALAKDDPMAKGSTISMNEIKGLVKLKLIHGKYHYTCNITIDEGYPTTLSNHDWGKVCHIQVTSTNLPSKIEVILTAQAQAFVRRLQNGMPEGEALKMRHQDWPSNPDGTKNSKPDVSNDTRPWQPNEQSRLAGYDIPTYDGTNPKISLLPLVKFLISKVQKLPEQQCPICDQTTFPLDPQDLASFYTKPAASLSAKDKKAHLLACHKRPMYSSCGCWYHYTCLHQFIAQPPFGEACPHDGRPVSHADWPFSREELERTWASKQARQREIDDAAMFF
jgi:hypothetical protein